MTEDPFKNRQEKVEPKIEVFEIPSPEVLKAIRELRLEVSKDPEQGFFIVTTPEKEESVTDEQRTKEFFGDGKFVILLWDGSQAMAMNRAEPREQGTWYIGSAITKPEFQGRGLGQKMFAVLLNEIRKRGGGKVVAAVKKRNKRSIYILQKLGFKNFQPNNPSPNAGFDVEIDLTDPGIIKKIDDALNAR